LVIHDDIRKPRLRFPYGSLDFVVGSAPETPLWTQVQLSALVTTGAPPAEPALRAVLQVRAGGAGAMMGVVILYILVNTWLRFPYIYFFIHAWWRWHHLHPQPYY
jgi:hypothetical protein